MSAESHITVQAINSIPADGANAIIASNLGIFSSSPSPWTLWMTTFIAVATFLWKVYTFMMERKEKKKARTLSIEDEYWHRQLINPICMEPFIDFLISFTLELRDIHSKKATNENIGETLKAFLEKFKMMKLSVINRFMILGQSNESAYMIVSEGLDDIDDIVTQHCASYLLKCSSDETKSKYFSIGTAEQDIYSHLGGVFRKLKDNHLSLFL